MGRGEQSAPTLQEMLGSLRKTFDKRYCLHPNAGAECNKIIRSHTVQRSGGLTKLARRGHVYALDPGDAEMSKTGMLSPRLVGVGVASTYAGFCNFHDTKTFAPVEKHPLEATPHHAFLLGYRALCRELFMKRNRVEHLRTVRDFDRGGSTEKQLWWQNFLSIIERGERSSLNHLERYKLQYDQCLDSDDYSNVSYYMVRFGAKPEFMCSGCIFPDYDFKGRRLQTLTNLDEVPHLVTFSVIATEVGGAAVFGWVGESQAGSTLVHSLHSLPEDEACHAISRFAFEYVENIFMSPDWWEGLSDVERRKLLRRAMSELRPDMPRAATCLKDDGLRIVSWPTAARETNVSFS